MAKKAVLFVDLLGVQKMWAKEGYVAVKNRIEEFNEYIEKQINFLSSDLHNDGNYIVVLSGDSASVICDNYYQAIGIGAHLFTQAFYDSDHRNNPFWLRGAISKWNNQYLTLNTVQVKAKNLPIGTKYVPEDDYLAVMALEKSGYRGMRLIIDKTLIDLNHNKINHRWIESGIDVKMVVKLLKMKYPQGNSYADVLWMLESEDHFSNLRGIMAKRFKDSVRNPDEMIQAAWTRAMFDQVDSIIWGLKNKKQ